MRNMPDYFCPRLVSCEPYIEEDVEDVFYSFKLRPFTRRVIYFSYYRDAYIRHEKHLRRLSISIYLRYRRPSCEFESQIAEYDAKDPVLPLPLSEIMASGNNFYLTGCSSAQAGCFDLTFDSRNPYFQSHYYLKVWVHHGAIVRLVRENV